MSIKKLRNMKNFGNVESKLRETEFFLDKLLFDTVSPISANYYLSAFASAARSITYAIQYNTSEIEGFKAWYQNWQHKLKTDHYAKLFHEIRNYMIHEGQIPIFDSISGKTDEGRLYLKHYLKIQIQYEEDVYFQAEKYFTLLISMVFDAYLEFGSIIDPNQYYTLENLEKLGLGIEDIEEELGFPRGWTKLSGPILASYLKEQGISSEEFRKNENTTRLRALKSGYSDTGMYILFEKYLGQEAVSLIHSRVIQGMEPAE
jgi:hypothetical protein